MENGELVERLRAQVAMLQAGNDVLRRANAALERRLVEDRRRRREGRITTSAQELPESLRGELGVG